MSETFTTMHHVLMDIADYFRECKSNSAIGSAAEKRFDVYVSAIIDADRMLKEQEPRMLTIEEVLACKSCGKWLWFEENAYGYIEESAVICAQIYDGFVDSCIAVNVPSRTLDETIELDCENYGKNWRCWSSKPTDEQREAVPWDD